MNHIRISASAVSGIIGRTGMKKAAKRGWSTGYDVTGYDVVVEVIYQTVDEAEQDEKLAEIKALFDARPGYRTEMGTFGEGSSTPSVKVYRTEEPTRAKAPKAAKAKAKEPVDGPKANAASVSRFLGDRGFTKSTSSASRVRGFANYYAGYEVQQGKDYVKVEYSLGNFARHDRDARKARQLKELAAMQAKLAERWDVELKHEDTDWPHLEVNQRRPYAALRDLLPKF